nr:hypothetical protein [Tanacetum cinerariifolium]
TSQQYGAILSIELTTDDIRNSKAYKENYACATGEAAPKPKASAIKKKGDSASSTTPPTPTPTTTVMAAPRLSATAKDERTGSRPGVSDVPSDDLEEELSWNSSDDEDVDEQTKGREESEGDKTDESDDRSNDGNDDDNDKTVKAGSESDKDDDDNDDEEELAKNDDEDTESDKGGDEVSEREGESNEEETRQEEEKSFDPIPRTPKGSKDEGSNEEDQELRLSEEARIQEEEEADELYGVCFHERLKSLEASFSEYKQTNPFAEAVSNIPGFVSYQRENDEFLRTIDDNMKRIIKERVKSQVKEQVSKILPRIEQSVNAQLEAEVLTRSSHSSMTSYAVAADLSEMELKKILIEKMEGNKSIQRSDEQRNLYKALVEAYEADKIILDTNEERVILKRRRDDDDQGKGPSAGSDRGSKRQREGKEPESASALLESTTRSAGRSTTGSKSRQASASEFAFVEDLVQTTS